MISLIGGFPFLLGPLEPSFTVVNRGMITERGNGTCYQSWTISLKNPSESSPITYQLHPHELPRFSRFSPFMASFFQGAGDSRSICEARDLTRLNSHVDAPRRKVSHAEAVSHQDSSSPSSGFQNAKLIFFVFEKVQMFGKFNLLATVESVAPFAPFAPFSSPARGFAHNCVYPATNFFRLCRT